MTNSQNIIKQYVFLQMKGNIFLTFWASIITYSIGYLLSITDHVPYIFCRLMMALGLGGMVYSMLLLTKFRITNSYFRFIFIIYSIWQIYIIKEALYDFNYEMLSTYLFSPYLLLPYLVPLVIFIPANIFYLRKIFDFFTVTTILLFIFFILFSNELLYINSAFSEQTVWTFGTGSGFLLLTWIYHNTKRRLISFSAVILSLFIATVMARRNIMLTFSNYLLFSILLIIFSSKQSIRSKIYLFTFILLTTFSIYYLFTSYQDILFSKISARFTQETRDVVFLAFFKDMSPNDLLFGKGFGGTYYCPGIEPDRDYRYLIESGYLQIILKGGYISLGLFLLVTLPAAYLGMIKSNNILSRATGAIVFLWLIDMVPWGMAAINIRYILLWTSISVCYSKEIRQLSDNEIINSFKLFRK